MGKPRSVRRRPRKSHVGDGNLLPLYRQWSGDASARYAPSTVRTYSYEVLRFLADVGAELPDTAGVRRYLEGLESRAHAGQVAVAVGSFYDYLLRTGKIPVNPIEELREREQLPRARGRQKIRRGLSEEELTRLLVGVVYFGRRTGYSGNKSRWGGERNALLVLAQYLTGLRPQELLRLTVDRVHLRENPRIEVTDTKTGNDRLVPLSPMAQHVFAELCRARVGRIAHIGRAQYWNIVSTAGRACALPQEKCRSYALRHSFATRLIARGVHVRVVADLLGHTDLRTMWTYTVPDDDDRRRAVELLDAPERGPSRTPPAAWELFEDMQRHDGQEL